LLKLENEAREQGAIGLSVKDRTNKHNLGDSIVFLDGILGELFDQLLD